MTSVIMPKALRTAPGTKEALMVSIIIVTVIRVIIISIYFMSENFSFCYLIKLKLQQPIGNAGGAGEQTLFFQQAASSTLTNPNYTYFSERCKDGSE